MILLIFLIVLILILSIVYLVTLQLYLTPKSIPFSIEYKILDPTLYSDNTPIVQVDPSNIDIVYYRLNTDNIDNIRQDNIYNIIVDIVKTTNRGRFITIVNDFESDIITSKISINTQLDPIILKNQEYVTLCMFEKQFRVLDSNISPTGQFLSKYRYIHRDS